MGEQVSEWMNMWTSQKSETRMLIAKNGKELELSLWYSAKSFFQDKSWLAGEKCKNIIFVSSCSEGVILKDECIIS